MPDRQDTVLVTGSDGFVGRRVVEELTATANVVGVDMREPEAPPAGTDFELIDLTDDHSVRTAMTAIRERHGTRIASVIHLAAHFDLSGEPDPLYTAVTVRGTERLLEALDDFAVEQFVFSSTMLVHQPAKPGRRIDESWPLEPKLPYRASKIETEELLRSKHGEIPLVLVRAAGVYDDGCHSPFLAHQIARIYEESAKSHAYPGDLQTAQAVVHVDDLAGALVRIVERRSRLPHELALLIGEPDAMPYAALQNAIAQCVHGKDWQTWQVPKPLAKTGAWLEDKVMGQDLFVKPWMVDAADDDYTLDISRAQELLGWQPQYRLEERLPVIIERLKKDPAAWYAANGLDPGRVAT
jgi:nucleoside-diphosphate-sugar epimerase